MLAFTGMGISTVTAGRILKGQKLGQPGEEGYLTFDRFPNVALLKVTTLDTKVIYFVYLYQY